MRNRGFALIASMSLLVFFTLATVSVMIRGLWQSGASIRIYNRSGALYLADAAADQAARNLVTADTTDDIVTSTMASGTFAIDPPQALAGSLYRVTARGTSGSEQRQVEVVFRLTPQSIFQYALFGHQNITIGGNAVTDSYNSSNGAYDENTAGHNGDIGTNATTAGGIAVSGSIFVDGQVAVGSTAATPQSVVTGYDPAFITGGTSPPSDTQDVVAQPNPFPMPAVTVPAGITCSNQTIQGNTTTTLSPTGGPLGNGVYCYENLTIQGNADLTASGAVTIYITGQLTAQGNSLVGVPTNPKQMVILMTSTADATLEQGTLQGNTEFYGALYAPQSTITISGNAGIFGSVIAQAVNVTGNAAIHYDESMDEVTQASNTFTTTRIAWREL